MSNHETPSPAFPDWYITFQQAALKNLPRPPALDKETALSWATERSEKMKRGFGFLITVELSSFPMIFRTITLGTHKNASAL
ncbi:MAG: hypothetical protein COU08_02715 [Candidatus Harrisonbacteria bacterium CG10_big_fil_rev_8_21_14_0_10_42_17]|uniref:Uncharacterized protein n=1 Tax=Candidatus Harrisonbacteria bacterium CG10_big_fil_rev_8_21_14_0_10_42_17 TaxID=1974584 RepID=A0A2M6WHX2_9BACT|nr:MAG: hypothetical protein COU08_02715 [Candidatus Harrisonbacteria bacterium CG10_big_fil_rev_8_21_14_0_10_42_17]